MVIKVFLSTRLKDITTPQYIKMCEYVTEIIRQNYDHIRDDDEIAIISNFNEKRNGNVVYPKLYDLSVALQKMSECEMFFLIGEEDKSIKPGCAVELNAWIAAGGCQPIIRYKWANMFNYKGE